ncbi:hypothetical protein [Nonomuraea insulae]|uniref:IPT/TIG domain-containing protein n=1 Tax=Nonomuraea insulae TaxID=1616787 RepID=A0ABW1CUB5_9ACTN
MRRYGVRALAAGAALTGALLAVAGPAHAATGVAVTGAGNTVLEITGSGVSDDITVSVAANGWLHVSNAADVVPAVAPCVAVNANEVECPPGAIARIRAATGNGDDTFRNRTALPSRVDMDHGKDIFLGGPAADEVRGGDGNDDLRGQGGNNDAADGGPGFDLCHAETEVACEA